MAAAERYAKDCRSPRRLLAARRVRPRKQSYYQGRAEGASGRILIRRHDRRRAVGFAHGHDPRVAFGPRRRGSAKPGACKLASASRVSSHFHHTGEELFYRGIEGSGTIFFTSCNMRCAFCQNGDISTDKDNGEETDPRTLATMAWTACTLFVARGLRIARSRRRRRRSVQQHKLFFAICKDRWPSCRVTFKDWRPAFAFKLPQPRFGRPLKRVTCGLQIEIRLFVLNIAQGVEATSPRYHATTMNKQGCDGI